jgi:triosephosphate isomerase
MKKYLIAGNWKMNFLKNETIQFAKELSSKLENRALEQVELLICAPFTNFHYLQNNLSDKWSFGAQNMHFADSGAYTGEVSPLMLMDAGCEYVILGHSERRQYFGEDNELLTKKINSALNHKLKPIFCIGETIEERNRNITFDILNQQLEVLKNVEPDLLSNITIAYEPVWAIGTGLTATTEQIAEVHSWINNYLQTNLSTSLKILYGGSMNAGNSAEILAIDNVSGGLIGGASLKVDQFMQIIDNAINLS